MQGVSLMPLGSFVGTRTKCLLEALSDPDTNGKGDVFMETAVPPDHLMSPKAEHWLSRLKKEKKGGKSSVWENEGTEKTAVWWYVWKPSCIFLTENVSLVYKHVLEQSNRLLVQQAPLSAASTHLSIFSLHFQLGSAPVSLLIASQTRLWFAPLTDPVVHNRLSLAPKWCLSLHLTLQHRGILSTTFELIMFIVPVLTPSLKF